MTVTERKSKSHGSEGLIAIRVPQLFSESRRLQGANRDHQRSLLLSALVAVTRPLFLSHSSSKGMSDIFKDKLFALELGLSVPFKQKAGLSKLITDNGGKVAYMINKKVRATVTKL